MNAASAPENLLLPEIVATRLLLTPRRVAALAKAGELPHVVIDGNLLFIESDIDNFIHSKRVAALSEGSVPRGQ